MCFGSKDEVNDDPAPKPVQNLPSHNRDVKRAHPPAHTSSFEAGSSGAYAPPDGPPPSHRQNEYAPPSGPPPSQRQNEYAPPSGPPPSHRQNEYAPPAGPPPSHRQDDYAPPSGPPPSLAQGGYAPPPGPPPSQRQDDYAPPPGPPPAAGAWDAPPPGPPPSHARGDYAPPPGPPPASVGWDAPPPGPPPSHAQSQHDWEAAVPDTSLFPPPPAIFSGFDSSPSSNATEDDAIHGENWCQQYPLCAPMNLDQPARTALYASNIRLIEPTGFNGKLNWLGPGQWEGSTAKNTPDRCIIAYPPLYVASEHNPAKFGQPKTVYYEVQILPNSREVFVGMGFTALPYPSFRMPGWHRGSLAIHGDDGHKYINDRWGGKTFTQPFRKGDTYGVGMTFTSTGATKPRVNIFFTRNGDKAGDWDLDEETDAEQDLPVTGLEGLHDLSCAIGTYDSVSFKVIFDPAKWMYKGLQS